MLSAQFYDGDCFAAALLGFGIMRRHQRMRTQKIAQPAPQRAGAVPVDDSHTGQVRERSVIQELVDLLGRLLDGLSDYVDFACG
jgi:hypothetical protein